MLVRIVVACSVVGGGACRLGFDPSTGSGDSAPDDATGGDGTSGDDGGSGDSAMITCPGTYTMLITAQTASRYRVVNNSSDWDAAEAACEADGHHLAIPNDDDELSALFTALLVQNIWIGVTDRVTPNTWRTVTGGTATFLPWSPGEPDGDECVFIDGLTTQLVDQGCGSGRRYICECDGAPADPASY